MIKTRIAVVAVAMSFVAAVFCLGATKTADPAASPAAAKATAPKKEAAKMAATNPHMGTWKLNEAKSKIPAGMYKNSTAVYTEQKDKMKVEVNGVDKDGKPTHGVWVGMADGKTYKTKGNLAWDSAAYKVVNDHTYQITTMKGGKVFTHGTSTVSKDGKTRTVATEGTGADGKKFKTKAVYDKA
jgi:hypothetical protein